MLEIRPEQMTAFERVARHQFHQRLRKMLRENMPRQTAKYDDEEMLRKIAAADAKAQTYGIETERGIGKFVSLEFLAGPAFDDRPKAKRFLTQPNIEPHHKIDTLFDYLVERERMAKGA